MLRGNNTKSCFLYCCLFTEDFEIGIRELVTYWRAEGLIGEGQNCEDMDEGISLIENLKDSCLLEDDGGAVKMHDVVRDVAIWISSTSEDGCKSLVRSGIGLSEISVGEFSNSNSLDRVSFMGNNITRLPDCMIQCSKASVLLLQDNHALDTIPEKFLQGFEALKVLNLGGTSIRSLPHSLLQLRDLRVLLLRYCRNLKELPSLGTLTKLRELDLQGTCIANLPRGIENLSELRILDLDDTEKLKSIQPGIISKLSCLERLSIWRSGCRFRLKGEEDGQATFEGLKSSFNRLNFLSTTLNGIPWEKSEDLSWINRMSYLYLCFQAQGWSVEITIEEKRCSIENLNLSLSQEWIGWFWGNSSSLGLFDCTGLVEVLEDFIKSDANFAGLKSLVIFNCPTNLGRGEGCAARCDLLPNLEELHLFNMINLNSISELSGHHGLRFHSLKSIEVESCSQMKCLLSCGDFIQTLPNLEVIKVNQCENLEELFNNESGQNISPDPMVPKLRILQLGNLPKFETLCRHEETWPCLEQVEVRKCKGLRRLPLTNQNAGTIKEIKGESEWWGALEWDDDQTKSSLLPLFHSCKLGGFGQIRALGLWPKVALLIVFEN
ncbi:hypothetical protein SO802_014736 [Lithocarpus litseifolius]|uniref:Uncharacterized protein n=1 Tax=Lithocarpus litseifolius TaxID=425828 RepID=A0AAW2CVV7_9ROSI